MLRAHVANGAVDYRSFKEKEAQVDAYLAALAAIDPNTLTEAERLALWINAYNAFTIKLILSRYPGIKSIKDIPRRWKRRDWVVGGERYSLDDIEHKILRKKFKEPRIHFAIVCASVSCPSLLPEAYVAERLDEQLTAAARGFLADPEKGFRIDENRVYLSSIFKWFRKDFEADGRSLVEFIAPYVAEDARAFLEEHGEEVSIRFLKYDWSLNERQ